jgi:DNA replication ATP-dependent helicase Dna2
LRSIIIDLQPPRFHTSPHPKGNPDSESTSGLNLNQISALNKVLSSKDYCLILGRPGTGKTTTISKLVQTMVGRGASVLVTSYTHSAVDNILLKLKEVVVSVHLYILMISLFTSASVHHSLILFCCPTFFGNALVGNVH